MYKYFWGFLLNGFTQFARWDSLPLALAGRTLLIEVESWCNGCYALQLPKPELLEHVSYLFLPTVSAQMILIRSNLTSNIKIGHKKIKT